MLRAPEANISDELLAYLLYHELLHHVLPGQGHDAQFREFEAKWPEAQDLNLVLDTLHEKWDMRTDICRAPANIASNSRN